MVNTELYVFLKKQTVSITKQIVKTKYAKIAEQGKAENASSCCGATNSSDKVYNVMMDDYSDTDGYISDADLGLGCGLPTQFAKINKSGQVFTTLVALNIYASFSNKLLLSESQFFS